MADKSMNQSTRGAGPSGMAMIHNKHYNSKGDTKDAAKHDGQGEPVHHSTGDHSGHYHATDSDGKKITDGKLGGVHYCYGKQK